MVLLTKEMNVKLRDGRIMSGEELLKDYERLLEMEREATKLKVGQWFRIDRTVIDKNKEEIRRKCYEEGTEGEKLWKRFVHSNEIMDESSYCKYGNKTVFETYIFEARQCRGKTEEELRTMCKAIGEGMCFKAICDLELQMRICNGESVHYLLKGKDEFPETRVICSEDEYLTGYFGGDGRPTMPPSSFNNMHQYIPYHEIGNTGVAYAFRCKK